MKILLICFLLSVKIVLGQNHVVRRLQIDSICKTHQIIGLSYAIVKQNTQPITEYFGISKNCRNFKINEYSVFSLGSCSKSITSLLAAYCVYKHKNIKWDSKFFDLYPELKHISKKEYFNITLEQLLSHRTSLISLTYENPPASLLQDTTQVCRYNLAKWILKQNLVSSKTSYNYSNAGYVLASLMLEKVMKKDWETLVAEMLNEYDIKPSYHFPNEKDTSNVWFHDEKGSPISPHQNIESGCTKIIAPAGMVFLNTLQMAKYLRIHLNGRLGSSKNLPQECFDKLHFGFSEYALGWMWAEKNSQRILVHQGNSGGWSFCEMRIYEKDKMGIVIFANSGSDKTMQGVNEIRKLLYEQYK